jgi:hypothetical protein
MGIADHFIPKAVRVAMDHIIIFTAQYRPREARTPVTVHHQKRLVRNGEIQLIRSLVGRVKPFQEGIHLAGGIIPIAKRQIDFKTSQSSQHLRVGNVSAVQNG